MQAYPHYPTRHIARLDGFWDFAWLGDTDWDRVRPDAFQAQSTMAVPGVFDTLPDYAQRRGIGMLRKWIPADYRAGERLRLCIGGLGLFARIWFDGRHATDCQLPYSPIEVLLTVESQGPHELTIAIDNRFDPQRVPLFRPNYDFYGYGGIYRRVELHRLPPCSINRARVLPLDIRTGRVRVSVDLDGDIPNRARLRVAFDGGAVQDIDSETSDGRIEFETTVPNPRIWSPDASHLHTIEVRLGDDCIRERFGLRTIETRGRKILLNGQSIELRGFNRHEAHPELGPVQTPSLMLSDLLWFKRMNANFVRCVHYPQDNAFFDLCDEMGMLVWTESLGWGNPPEQLADPLFADLQEEQTRLMVRTASNHPSVIVWAFLNEADSASPEAVPLYRRLVDAIRQEDPSRLVSYASNREMRDRCFDCVDIVSLNTYPGWIGDTDWETPSIETIAPKIAELADALSKHSPFAQKPLFFSEIGACALYGSRDLAHSQWTEEYQADYMAEAVRVIRNHPRTCGLTLWQFHDSRSYGPLGAVRTKPRGINNAGVLDEYRRPKLAATAVGKVFAEPLSRQT